MNTFMQKYAEAMMKHLNAEGDPENEADQWIYSMASAMAQHERYKEQERLRTIGAEFIAHTTNEDTT